MPSDAAMKIAEQYLPTVGGNLGAEWRTGKVDGLARDIDAAVRAEREACALLAENEPEPSPHDAPEAILISSPVDAAIGGIRATKRCIAKAIRARNEGVTDAK